MLRRPSVFTVPLARKLQKTSCTREPGQPAENKRRPLERPARAHIGRRGSGPIAAGGRAAMQAFQPLPVVVPAPWMAHRCPTRARSTT